MTEVKTVLGSKVHNKFPDVAQKLIVYARENNSNAVVQKVLQMWDTNLKGETHIHTSMDVPVVHVANFMLSSHSGYDVILALRVLLGILGNKRAKVDPEDLIKGLPVSH